MSLRVAMLRAAAVLAAATTAMATATLPAAADRPPDRGHFHAGAPGAGDPYFPNAGNGGFDVQHYTLNISYAPSTNHLAGTAVVRAVATENLDQFDLDLRREMAVSAVKVNGHRARYTRSGTQELVITPRPKLHAGRLFTVTVTYAGEPEPVIDPDGSSEGWIPTDDGAFVVGEPQGSPSWYPSSDHPTDKATFTTRVTVPAGVEVVGNGLLLAHTTAGGRETFVWNETRPMATYLATVTLGDFQIERSTTPGGLPVYVALDPREAAGSQDAVAQIPDIVGYFSDVFGPYPFESTGAIVDHARFVGYALETQTKPVFDRAPGVGTMAHELAHQWYGDSVSLERWQDIWLNEGFAEYASWLYQQHIGGPTTQERFDSLYATPASDTRFWNPPSGDPGGPARLFAGSVYRRGAMTLQALRGKVGDDAFFEILSDWASQHRYGNANTADFIALAEKVSGTDLGHFFDVWLYQPGKPTSW